MSFIKNLKVVLTFTSGHCRLTLSRQISVFQGTTRSQKQIFLFSELTNLTLLTHTKSMGGNGIDPCYGSWPWPTFLRSMFYNFSTCPQLAHSLHNGAFLFWYFSVLKNIFEYCFMNFSFWIFHAVQKLLSNKTLKCFISRKKSFGCLDVLHVPGNRTWII